MKALILILFLATSTFCQEFVGLTKENAYYVQAGRKVNSQVYFAGVIMGYTITDGKYVIDPEKDYMVTSFTANCVTFEYKPLFYRGTESGKLVEGELNIPTKKALPKQLIFLALEKVCGAIEYN